MAKRSRQHRHEIPGYDDRPSRDDRKLSHRATRHAAHQMLHAFDDPDELVLPEQRRSGGQSTASPTPQPEPRRFKVWKTKFWKRRDDYRAQKADLDSQWPVVGPDPS